MNKDVIYIDTEDDVTAIIGKIKNSQEKIVALVPPKRIGILQSAVNLRLLARMADNAGKRLVLVTNNKALINLSSVAKIPVARNLQSKPEMAEIDILEVDDGEDVIEGKELPIGELMKTADIDGKGDVIDAIDAIDINEDIQKIDSKNTEKNKIKVPNFSSFRKKLFIGILLAIALAIFLVWAIIFAPAAKVIITANTSPASVSMPVKLGGTAATDVSKGIIQTISKQIIKDVSVTFTATGQKDIGNKATGTITIENCDTSAPLKATIAANTIFVSSSGQSFVSNSEVAINGFTGSASECNNKGIGVGTGEVAVTAVESGEDSNIAASDFTITGDSRYLYARGGQMTGGTTKISTVVTDVDIQKASQALTDLSSESVKQLLIKQFTNGESVIGDSFTIVHATPVSNPAVGVEATAKATLTSSTTFTITAIAKTELEVYLKDNLTKQLTGKDQRIYDDGIAKVTLSDYLSTDQGTTIKIFTDASLIGPNIDQASIKNQVKGKQFGDAQAILSDIPGVDTVDIQFSYFWVKRIPTDVEKIEVEFILKNAKTN